MKKLLGLSAIFAVFFISFSAYAQVPDVYFGKVVSSVSEEPVPFANVAFIDSSEKVAAMAICNDGGIFLVSGINPGKYRLNISCVGFEPYEKEYEIKEGNARNIGVFVLTEGVELQEVTVKGYAMISSKVDRLVYDVEQDSTAPTIGKKITDAI